MANTTPHDTDDREPKRKACGPETDVNPSADPRPGQWTAAELQDAGISHGATSRTVTDKSVDTDDGTALLNSRMPDRRVKATSFKRHAEPTKATSDLDRVAEEYDPFGHSEVEKAGTQTYDDLTGEEGDPLSLSLKEIREARKRSSMTTKDAVLALLDRVDSDPAARDALRKELDEETTEATVEAGDQQDTTEALADAGEPSAIEKAAVEELSAASGHSPDTVRTLLAVKERNAERAESYRELAGYFEEGSEGREAALAAAQRMEKGA